MKTKERFIEIIVILLASVILSISTSFMDSSALVETTIYFIIILGLNVVAKKLFAYFLEADLKTKFWSWYQYGFRKDFHFKKPLPMAWLPLLLSLISRGLFWWFAILDFDVQPRTERVSRRHGLYRFSEMTDWDISLIVVAGIVTNLVLAIVGYIVGFEFFARLNIYFAAWSLLPLSSLDGSKLLMGSRALWFTMFVIVGIFLGFALAVV